MAPSRSPSNFSSPYAPAANILNQIFTKRKGLKTIAYSREGELTCSKATYAQCSHVLEQKTLLDALVKELQSSSKMEVKNEGLLYVLLYELLLGPNKKIRGGGAVKRQLMKHEHKLQASLERLQKENGGTKSSQSFDGNTVTIPRYVRINILVGDRDDILNEIKAKLGDEPVYIDPHVPDMVVVAPTPENRGLLQDLVKSQKIVLQDKSSCFSALCLMHGFSDDDTSDDGDFLDACAAPGNKTSHLAALIHQHTTSAQKESNVPVVHALDKAPDRYKLLKRRMGELCPDGSVHSYNLDFLDINSPKNNKLSEKENKTFENVRAILLDPSCSGSGMTSNHTELSLNHDPYFANDRVKSLSDFQFQALRHAITNFPLVDRVVYSTCSRYYAENEGVVQRVLNATDGEWELVAPKCLASWPRRGLTARKDDNDKEEKEHCIGLTKEQAKCLIRVDPDHDATNGFFVACFERVRPNDDKKKKRKKKDALLWESPAAISDMDLYDNQFHVKNKKSTVANASSISKKRKQPSDERKEAQTKPADASSAISKKRAKKLEWKKQQRLKKEERVKRKLAQHTESK